MTQTVAAFTYLGWTPRLAARLEAVGPVPAEKHAVRRLRHKAKLDLAVLGTNLDADGLASTIADALPNP